MIKQKSEKETGLMVYIYSHKSLCNWTIPDSGYDFLDKTLLIY